MGTPLGEYTLPHTGSDNTLVGEGVSWALAFLLLMLFT